MISFEKDQSFDRSERVQDCTDTVTTEVVRFAIDGCDAVGAAVRLRKFNDTHIIIRSASGDPKTLRRHLKTAALQDTTDADTAQQRVTVDDTELVLVHFPLSHENHLAGSVVLAIPTARWCDWNSRNACANVVKLAAMLLESRHTNHELELDLVETNRRLQIQSRKVEIDPLTTLENKASFEKKCRARLADRTRPAALLAIDLDHFKQINDIYGHQFGDRYLAEVAAALKSCCPKGSVLGRNGGDEFCALLDTPKSGKSYLKTTIQMMRNTIQRNLATLGKPELGGVSIGVSLFPTQAVSYDQLLAKADRALYASKRTERNTTTTYQSALDALAETAIGVDANGKVDFSKITCFFQPLCDIKTNNHTGFELLARWRKDNGMILSPDAFGWMFRDHRFGSSLTCHIVDHAFTQLTQAGGLRNDGSCTYWINVSEQDLLCPEFVFDLQVIFAQHMMDWNAIVIEVNEDIMFGKRNGVVFNTLQEIRQRGGRVALDDFGIGSAGLLHLDQWPVDIVKIDRSFVQKAASDPSANVVVKALVMIADTLDQHIVAEGIETQTQLDAMKAVGCHSAQGFLFAKPKPAAELAA